MLSRVCVRYTRQLVGGTQYNFVPRLPTSRRFATFEKKESAEEADFFNKEDAAKFRSLLNKLETSLAPEAKAASNTAPSATQSIKSPAQSLKKIFDSHRISLTTKLEADLMKWKTSS